MVWLTVTGIFNVHTDVDTCDCTRGLYGHGKRVCTGSWLWNKNPLPQRGLEPLLVMRLVFQSDALPAEQFAPHCSVTRRFKEFGTKWKAYPVHTKFNTLNFCCKDLVSFFKKKKKRRRKRRVQSEMGYIIARQFLYVQSVNDFWLPIQSPLHSLCFADEFIIRHILNLLWAQDSRRIPENWCLFLDNNMTVVST